MAIGIFVGVLIAILFGVCIAVAATVGDEKAAIGGIAIILAIALFISFIFVPFSFHTVSSGEVAVVKHLGKIEDVKTAGTHFDLWATNKYIKYDTKVVSLETQTAAYSSDASVSDQQRQGYRYCYSVRQTECSGKSNQLYSSGEDQVCSVFP